MPKEKASAFVPSTQRMPRVAQTPYWLRPPSVGAVNLADTRNKTVIWNLPRMLLTQGRLSLASLAVEPLPSTAKPPRPRAMQ
jgi:hypothetical protein